MKRILLLALVGTMFVACKEDEPFKFREDTIYLNGVENPRYKSTARYHSLYEILRDETVEMWIANKAEFGDQLGRRGFSDAQRDTINNRLLMWSTDILSECDGEIWISRDFIRAEYIYLTINNGTEFDYTIQHTAVDTIGYIPISVLRAAEHQIDSLFALEKYAEIYDLFHTAFTFYTCTGAEYKAIMENGGN